MLSAYLSSVISCQHLGRGAEVHFCDFWQDFGTMDPHQLLSRSFDGSRDSLGEDGPKLSALILEPQDKLLSGQNRGCGHRDVSLRFRSLLDLNPSPGINQSTQDDSLIRELIGERTGAVGSILQQILYHPGVAPAEQVVQISELDIKFIISFGPD